MSELGQSGWSVIKYKDIESKEDRRYFADYFERELLPLISPQVISKDNHFHLSIIVKCMSLYALNRKR